MGRELRECFAVRPARIDDLGGMVEIYNHYIVHTPVTFDLESFTTEGRRPWFEQFGAAGRYRLFVAEEEGRIVGYAGSFRHRSKAAYDTSVEVTVYCAPDRVRNGLGSRLYEDLFRAIESEDVHRALAGITLPNPASVAFHRKFGFVQVGHFTEQGRKFGRYWDVVWLEKPIGQGL